MKRAEAAKADAQKADAAARTTAQADQDILVDFLRLMRQAKVRRTILPCNSLVYSDQMTRWVGQCVFMT